MSQPSSSTARAGVRARRSLVTGGAGFIGSHLTERLLARGDEVTVVDDLSTGRRENLAAIESTTRGGRVLLRFIEADLREALGALGRGETFDEIYHLAAAVGVKRVLDQPIESIETNIEQTSALLRFAAERSPAGADQPGIPTLIASSSEVYGKSDRNPFREEDDAVYGPTSVTRWSYACSKAIDEHLALAYAGRRGLPVVVVRFFNTVGPRQVGDYGMVLPRFVRAAMEGRTLEVFGDGRQSRCFCDVRDAAGALPALLGSAEASGRVFNLGADRPITIGELAQLVITTLGSSSKIRHVPYEEAYPEGFEDLQQRRPCLDRVREIIGFEPKISLEETIRAVAEQIRGEGVPV